MDWKAAWKATKVLAWFLGSVIIGGFSAMLFIKWPILLIMLCAGIPVLVWCAAYDFNKTKGRS